MKRQINEASCGPRKKKKPPPPPQPQPGADKRSWKFKTRCGWCANCIRDHCGKCIDCLDMPIFGGSNQRRNPCVLRKCLSRRPAKKNPKREDQGTAKSNSVTPPKTQSNSRKAPEATGSRFAPLLFDGIQVESFSIPSKKEEAAASTEKSFADFFFGKTFVVHETLEKGGSNARTKWTIGAITGELVSSRVLQDNNSKGPKRSSAYSNSNQWTKKRKVRYLYVAVQGPGIPRINVQNRLGKYWYFASIPAEKRKARLELVDSTGIVIYENLLASHFKVVEENQYCGCGFFPPDMAESLFGRALPGAKNPRTVAAVQVRVFSPKLGIFKGMLLAKPGINRVELPTSMRKVNPIRPASNHPDWVCIVVKRTFPSEANYQLGRYLCNDSDNPPLSFFNSKRREPSEEMTRVWEGLGVSKKVISAYVNKCLQKTSISGLKHTHLIGVADPTGKLPKGCIYVSGMTRKHKKVDKVFISRSPCVELSDGILLKLVRSRPSAMSKTDWKMLTTLPFGMVVFGSPRGDRYETLPQQVAGGDLDGDLFFVCWDNKIIDGIKIDRPRSDDHLDTKLLRTASLPRKNWLKEAQGVMLATDRSIDTQKLYVDLYTMSKKVAEEKGMKNRLAVQLARAYKKAIDLEKHGGKLAVPKEVFKTIPKSLHHLIVAKKN